MRNTLQFTKAPKILVTGSSGMIGTRLCEFLLKKNVFFLGIDKIKNRWNRKVNRQTLVTDLLNPNQLADLPGSIDTVIHLASNARVYPIVKKPELGLENIQTTFSILEFARKRKISKFIFASSREVYGDDVDLPAIEEDVDIQRTENPYSASKVAGESLLHAYASCYSVPFVILRFSNVYGRYDLSDRVIPTFLKILRNGDDITIFGSKKIMDFTYIDDVVQGIELALQKFSKVQSKSLNIASGEGTSLQELANLMMKAVGAKTQVKVQRNRRGEVMQFIADISFAQKKLGYSPKFSLEKGLRKTVKWYEKYLEAVD